MLDIIEKQIKIKKKSRKSNQNLSEKEKKTEHKNTVVNDIKMSQKMKV